MKKLCSQQNASTARGCIICTVHAWELLPLTHGVNAISTTRCGIGCSCDDRYSILHSIECLWCNEAPQGRVECIDRHWDCTSVLFLFAVRVQRHQCDTVGAEVLPAPAGEKAEAVLWSSACPNSASSSPTPSRVCEEGGAKQPRTRTEGEVLGSSCSVTTRVTLVSSGLVE